MRIREARPSGAILLYDLLLPLAAVAAAPLLVARALGRAGSFAHMGERLGRLPRDLAVRLRELPGRPIWIQAASVGEVMLARRLAEAARAAGGPHRMPPVVMSSNTPAGRRLAAASEGLAGAFHLPLDWSPFVRRAMEVVRPAAFISVETEIWPGMLSQCLARGVPAVIVNGRISARSLASYRWLGPLLREPLRAVRLACMQTTADAERAEAIGVAPDRIVVTGNMKFDAGGGAAAGEELRRHLAGPGAGGPVLVAGSTSEGEEEVVLDALAAPPLAEVADLRLILAPRHPERFEQAARLLAGRGVPFVRRSGPARGRPWKVLLLDTVGELAGAYALGRVAFVGGSLVPRGGQNVIEPAAHGVPVLFGPHTENFAAVADALLEAGAGFRVDGAAAIAAAARRLLDDDGLRARSGEAGRALVARNRGATERTVAHLRPLLGLDG